MCHGKGTVTDYGKKVNTNAKKQECDRDWARHSHDYIYKIDI